MTILPHYPDHLFPRPLLILSLFFSGANLFHQSPLALAGSSLEKNAPDKGRAFDLLKRAKVLMLHGRLSEAERHLEEDHPKIFLRGNEVIRERYLALIFVAQGRWQRALKTLESPALREGIPYQKTCALAFLGAEALGRGHLFSEDFSRCFARKIPKEFLKEEKKVSLDALERSIPLSWIERKISSGTKALNSLARLRSLEGGNALLHLAFMTERGEAQKALKSLRSPSLSWEDRRESSVLLTSLKAFNHFVAGQPKRALLAALKLCSRGENFACSTIGPLSRREKWTDAPIPSPEGIDLQELFEAKSDLDLNGPSKVTEHFIDQWDIERMDSMEQKQWFSGLLGDWIIRAEGRESD